MSSRFRKIIKRSLIGMGILTLALWIIPAPLSGYWHTPVTDCLCDSKNLLVFEGGNSYEWATGHGKSREPSGTYERGLYWTQWHHGKDGRIEIKPGWFLMRIKLTSPEGTIKSWGWRELRPGFIKEVLNSSRTGVEKPISLQPYNLPKERHPKY